MNNDYDAPPILEVLFILAVFAFSMWLGGEKQALFSIPISIAVVFVFKVSCFFYEENKKKKEKEAQAYNEYLAYMEREKTRKELEEKEKIHDFEKGDLVVTGFFCKEKNILIYFEGIFVCYYESFDIYGVYLPHYEDVTRLYKASTSFCLPYKENKHLITKENTEKLLNIRKENNGGGSVWNDRIYKRTIQVQRTKAQRSTRKRKTRAH